MAPKLASSASPTAKKCSDTKAAGKILSAAKKADVLQSEKSRLKEAITKLQNEKKKELRRVRALKKKASKVDLADLMQMLMMKAYLHAKSEASSSSSGASSSSADWVPANGIEALDKLRMLATTCQHPEVKAFAETLKATSSTVALNLAAEDPEE